MSDLEAALKQLRYLCDMERKIIQERRDLMGSGQPRDLIEDQDRLLGDQLNQRQCKTSEFFRRILEFPPCHRRHEDQLADFHAVFPYEESVFIMTKFPESDAALQTDLDRQLECVIDAVKTAVRKHGCEPRLASDKKFHPMLWDNVELYLLGCYRGIAIVEDKYRPEFNPNVAMEWGWMRGMKREVLYLVEDSFESKRADTEGFLNDRFVWDDPVPGVKKAVDKWLG